MNINNINTNTTFAKCDECGKPAEKLVRIGEKYNAIVHTRTADICFDCVKAAMGLIEADIDDGEDVCVNDNPYRCNNCEEVVESDVNIIKGGRGFVGCPECGRDEWSQDVC